jgi:hypothetical protein
VVRVRARPTFAVKARLAEMLELELADRVHIPDPFLGLRVKHEPTVLSR